jgi:hypothetical protein
LAWRRRQSTNRRSSHLQSDQDLSPVTRVQDPDIKPDVQVAEAA